MDGTDHLSCSMMKMLLLLDLLEYHTIMLQTCQMIAWQQQLRGRRLFARRSMTWEKAGAALGSSQGSAHILQQHRQQSNSVSYAKHSPAPQRSCQPELAMEAAITCVASVITAYDQWNRLHALHVWAAKQVRQV